MTADDLTQRIDAALDGMHEWFERRDVDVQLGRLYEEQADAITTALAVLRECRDALERLRAFEPCDGDPCADDCEKCGSGKPWLLCGDCGFYAASDGA